MRQFYYEHITTDSTVVETYFAHKENKGQHLFKVTV